MNPKILIIDDERWYFEPVLERLEIENISFDFCKNGSTGIKKLKENSYFAIVLDMIVSLGDDLIHLQNDDVPGITIFKKIRETNRDIPIICWTVLSDEEIRNKINQLRGTYFLKGKDDIEFIEKIKSLAK